MAVWDGGGHMWSVHLRMAELWEINKKRELTADELTELRHCLEANANLAFKLAKLKNMSLMASMINDTEWNHEICAEIQKITDQMII